jgi:hypothetical protein
MSPRKTPQGLIGLLVTTLGVVHGAGCSSTSTASCYTEQHDKSNDLNTANDIPPAGPEDTGLVLGSSSVVICGAVNQGNFTTHDDNTADGDSFQFTVNAHVTGTLTLSVTGDVPPAPQFRVFILTPTDLAVTGDATLGAAVAFDLQPGTYIANMEAKQAAGPLSKDYPYEISFDIGATH